MIVKKFLLFTLVSIVGNHLGKIQCLTRDQFLKFEATNFSGEGAPSTVFRSHEFNVKNTSCLFALLRHVVLYTGVKPPDRETFPIADQSGGSVTAYKYYRTYLLTNLHLLSLDIFSSYKVKLKEIVKHFMAWTSPNTARSESLLKAVQELIDAGYQQNAFFLEREYFTERSSENFYLEYTTNTSYFHDCREMYLSFKYDEIFLNLLEDSLKNDEVKDIVQWRVDMYKTIPIVMKHGIVKIQDRMFNKNTVDKSDFHFMIFEITKFYTNFINETMSNLDTLLCWVSDKTKHNVEPWDEKAFKDMIKLYIIISTNIKQRLEILNTNLPILKRLAGDAYISSFDKPNFEIKKQSVETTLETVMQQEKCAKATNFTVPDYLVSILPYYPNFKLFPSQFSNEFMKAILDYHAWTSILSVNMQMVISVASNAGIEDTG